MQSIDGASFLINGKVDGHARADASTQVMSGLMGAALHPEPRLALVVGLGTGSTAGWLAEVESIERVDVVELEPAILEVAQDCRPVNRDVLAHPKVRVLIGDGREVLLTSGERYDVIFSEPSNPYRAGIASLFTRDFYDAVSRRLTDDGIFVQWLQGYEVDGQIVRTALATLGAVFASVETWQTNQVDLLLLAGNRPLRHDAERLERRLQTEPFRFAMNRVWGVSGAAGFYAGFIASQEFTQAVLQQERRWINTDDRPIIEFGFARSVGRGGLFETSELISLARRRGESRPPELDPSAVDWEAARELRAARSVAATQVPGLPEGAPPETVQRIRARRHYARGELRQACLEWSSQPREPTAPIDVLMVAECLAEIGDDRAPGFAEALRRWGRDLEAELALARWWARTDRVPEAVDSLVAALEGYRRDPWPHPPAMQRLLELAAELARSEPRHGRRIFAALSEPFSLDMLGEIRRATLLDVARSADFAGLCVTAFEQYGRWVAWEEPFLRERLRCFRANNHPAAPRALRDLQQFLAAGPFPLATGMEPASR
jgi:hypothetical protein